MTSDDGPSSSKLERPTWTSPPPDAKSAEPKSTALENKRFGTGPFGIKIENRADRGRGLFATKSFKRGDTVYSTKERPPAAVLSTDKLSTNCSACFLTPRDAATARESWGEDKLKRCATCKIVHYCSAACAKVDWALHKVECKAFMALRKRYIARNPGNKPQPADFVPAEGSRALARLLWAKKMAKEAGEPCPAWEEFVLLQSQIDPEAEKMEKLEKDCQRLAYYLGIIENISGGEHDNPTGVLMKIYGIDSNPELELMKLWSRTNAFTLDSPDLTALGVIVAPGLAMANHSCEPNAVVVFPKGKGLGQMTAIKPIKSGEEILVCYIDVASPYSVRHSELSTRYNFFCNCTLCQRESNSAWVDPRWCLSHPGCKQKGTARMPDTVFYENIPDTPPNSTEIVAPTGTEPPKCAACGKTFKVSIKALLSALNEGKFVLKMDELGALETDLAGSIRSVAGTCSKLLALCPPSSYPLISLHRLLVRLLTITTPNNLQTLAPPMHHLALAIEGATQVYASTHPTMAILLAQKARLLGITFPLPADAMATVRGPVQTRVELKRLESAIQVLKEACLACAACFGRDGGIVGLGMKMELTDMEPEVQAYRLHLSMAGIAI